MNLYNEIVPHAAKWIENLVAAGHVAPGRVDQRSVADLAVDDVRGATQFHTFAGIGVWSRALRLAGWPDDVPVWTGSCPCQPFSQAGDRAGFDDPRHLWPAWFRLIAGARPPVVFGEQVASKDGLAWLDVVLADLEGAGYAVRAFDLCAAGVGAPHIRQRLYFCALDGDRGVDVVGDAGRARGGRDGRALPRAEGRARGRVRGEPDAAVAASDAGDRRPRELADAEEERRGSRRLDGAHGWSSIEPVRLGVPGAVADDDDDARLEGRGRPTTRGLPVAADAGAERGPFNGFWSGAEWLACTDGKSRPVEPGTFPLVDGLAGRVGLLRAYGNAIVAPLAAEFVGAVMDGAA